MLHRFSRLEMIVGSSGLQKLADAKVAVFGLGGVGGSAAEALARSGIGSLVIIDYDQVCLTNINRQVIAVQSTVGRYKVEVMKERIKEINPECNVICYNSTYTPETASELLAADYDYVIDAIDMVTSKLDLLERCYNQQIPIISAMGAGNKLDPTKLEIVDISKTHTCPLAKVVRLELRKRGIAGGIKVVFSSERPLRPIQGESESSTSGRRSIPGSSAVVPPVSGYLMASVVIREILGV